MPVCVENNFLVLRRSQERKCQKQTVPHSVDDSLDILLGLTKFCEIEILKAANSVVHRSGKLLSCFIKFFYYQQFKGTRFCPRFM